MGSFAERFNNHNVFDRLSETQNILERARETASDLGGDTFDTYLRIETIFEETDRRLGDVDPTIVPMDVLNAIEGSITNVRNELRSFADNKNPAHVTNANSYAENVLSHLSRLIIPASPEDIEGIRESVVSFKKSIGQHRRNLEQELEETANRLESLKGKIQEAEDKVNAQQSRLDSVISDHQQQFSRAQESRREKFSEEQESQREAFEDIKQDGKESLDKLLDESRDAISEIKQDTRNRSKEIIDDIGTLKDDAEKLVGIIARTGMAEGYQRVADEASAEAKKWRNRTVATLIAVVVTASLVFISLDGLSPAFVVRPERGLLAVSIATLAGYMAAQTRRFHNLEERNRRMQLELTSIDSYLAHLPEEDQHAIKRDLAYRFFRGDSDVTGAVKESRTLEKLKQTRGSPPEGDA